MSWILVLLLLLLLLMACGIGYLSARQTLGGKPALRKLLYTCTFIMGAFGLTIFIIYLAIPKSLEIRPIRVSFLLLIIFLCFVFFFRWIWLTNRAGKTLLSLRRHDKLFIIFGMLGLFSGLLRLALPPVMNKPDLENILDIIVPFSFGLVMLIIGLKGSKFLEKGIASSGQFWAWDKIKSYEWNDSSHLSLLGIRKVRFDHRLTLKSKRSLSFPFLILHLPIPPHNKEEVDKLLTENMAKSA